MNEIQKIEEMLEDKAIGEDVAIFFDDILKGGFRPFLLGGAIRDAIEGKQPRDLDIMLTKGEDDDFIEILFSKNIDYARNSFGGYKLTMERITIDVWFMRDHYIFKKNIYKQKPSNIRWCTFLNIDSLVYDMWGKRIDIRCYDECVKNNRIDFVGKSEIVNLNPNPVLTIIKIFESSRRYGYSISEKIINYVALHYNIVGERFWSVIKKEYMRHFGKEMSEEQTEYMKWRVNRALSENFEHITRRNNIKGQYNIYDLNMVK